jgi:hypothetical protein
MQQQGSRNLATAANPEPAPRKPNTQQQHWRNAFAAKQAVPQPSSSSTSCSSYSTASEDSAAEPMDVCSSPPTPPPTANNSNSYNSADNGDSSSSSRRGPVMPTQQQQQQQQATSKPAAATTAAQQQVTAGSSMDAQTAATVIQAAWRMYRLARHQQALKQLAAAANQLRGVRSQLAASTAAAAAAGTALSQKQFLELSETVMKVLFTLDSVSCGTAVELRTARKRLTTKANGLLDQAQAAYKAQPAALQNAQQQQQQQQQQCAVASEQLPPPPQQQQQGRQSQKRRPATSSSYQRLRRLAGYF